MTATDFEIIEAEWPEDSSPSRKAITDFLASDLQIAEIKGDKEFLQNVRRMGRTNADLKNKVEFKAQNNRLFIRRKELHDPTTTG